MCTQEKPERKVSIDRYMDKFSYTHSAKYSAIIREKLLILTKHRAG
jgi:hypothetical protein